MRKLLMLFAIVAIALAMLELASGVLARQGGRLAATARGLAGARMLAREQVEGPAWVQQHLPRSRGQGGDGKLSGGVDSGGRVDHRRSFSCNGRFSKMTLTDVVVGPSAVCQLTDSVIRGDVSVQPNGDFEAGATSIGGDLQGDQALTVYLYRGSDVQGSLETRGTAQVFAFNSAVGGRVSVFGSTDQVFLCNNKVGGGITVERSGPNILVGDYRDPHCPGNVVQRGNVLISQNATYVELVVGDNVVRGGSMSVIGNTGTHASTSGESVQGNNAGNALLCSGNASPFVGSPNPGWQKYGGQCSARSKRVSKAPGKSK